jgi:hypothetical protein
MKTKPPGGDRAAGTKVGICWCGINSRHYTSQASRKQVLLRIAVEAMTFAEIIAMVDAMSADELEFWFNWMIPPCQMRAFDAIAGAMP